MITFHNPGTLDPRLITTMGVNVKDTSSPIGQFGTGLKYAIAVLLRTGHEITMETDEAVYNFSTKEEVIRGKTFSLCHMNDSPLPFTTEYGKNWEVWMAYRELVTNAWDEHGKCAAGKIPRKPGHTVIYIEGSAIAECQAKHHQYFLKFNIFIEDSNIEIHHGASTHIYYRGIRAGELPMTSLLTYNITTQMALTEDRTLAVISAALRLAEHLISITANPYVLEKVITAEAGELEGHFNFHSCAFSKAFIDLTVKLDRRGLVGNKTLLTRINTELERARPQPILALTGKNAELLARALEFLAKSATPITETVHVFKTLPGGAYGAAVCGFNPRILLSLDGFELGLKQLVITLLEEQLHITSGQNDFTRAFQEAILACAVREMEEKQQVYL